MKKLLYFLIFSLLLIKGFSQTNSNNNKHLTFKGIPINGKLNEYISKLENSGLSHVITKDGQSVLKGDFAGYKDCRI